ncbi:MAG: DNA-directed RNA polymerase subunit omega [Bryobacteraceae bacterium]
MTIFILAPSREILEQRLRARSEDAEAVIERRSTWPMRFGNYSAYDYVLINNELTSRIGVGLCVPSGSGAAEWKTGFSRFWKHLRRDKADFRSMGDKIPRPTRTARFRTIFAGQSTYRFITVAAKRARQLQSGARPVLPTPSSKKPTIIAMGRRRGLRNTRSPA